MRFLVLLTCVVLAAASGALSLLLGPVAYEKLRSIGHLLYLEDEFARLPLMLTLGRYLALRWTLFGVLGSSLGALFVLLRQPATWAEMRGIKQEISAAWAALVQTVRGLSTAEKAVAAGLLAALLGVRAYLVLDYGFRYDEILSYQFFVREGAVAISSFYPLPNNHVFFNLCCAAGSPVLGQHPLLLMRLPSLLAATVGTALCYVLLTRFTKFWLATLVTGLFNFTPATLLYAASGRGYYLQLVLIQLGFFAVVGLGSRPDYRRLAWLVFVVSSVLGLYTIPTYAYPLASLLLGAVLVLLAAPPREFRGQMGELLVAGLLIGLSAAVLYAPVGAVSGWPRLLANSYISPLSWAEFLSSIKATAYESTEVLFGTVRPVLLGGAALAAWVPLAQLRARLTPTERSMLWVTWAQLVVPVAVVVAQRTYPPVRALMYLAFFGFLLAALAAWVGARRWRGTALPQQLQLAVVTACVLGAWALRFGFVLDRVRSSQHEEMQLTQAWHWLQVRQPQRVLLASYELFFYHYASQSRQPVILANRPVPGRRYDYLVLPPTQQAAPAWTQPLAYRAMFRNDLVSIFALSPLPASAR